MNVNTTREFVAKFIFYLILQNNFLRIILNIIFKLVINVHMLWHMTERDENIG